MVSDRFSKNISWSILLHALAVGILLWITHYPPLRAPQPKDEITVILDPTQFQVNQQVVQSTAGEKTKEAAKDAYLGKETRTVDRQTTTQIQKMASKSVAKPQVKQEAKTESQPEKEKTLTKREAEEAPLSKFGVPILAPLQVKPKDTPNFSDFAADFGGATAQDYVKGLKESETSALNTREFAYYGYFQRIRTQLDRAWQTILHEKLVRLYRDGRTLASEQEHTTRTVVTLDKKGEVIKVQVLEESGVIDLDDAAVKAFNQAGPFPNPPMEMVDAKGTIQIRWDFILKT